MKETTKGSRIPDSSKTHKPAQQAHTMNIKKPVPPEYALLAGIALPFVSWLLASLINPSGWMSKDIRFVLWPLEWALYFWPSLLLALLLIVSAVLVKKTRTIICWFVFVVMFMYSIFIFYETVIARENEFTG